MKAVWDSIKIYLLATYNVADYLSYAKKQFNRNQYVFATISNEYRTIQHVVANSKN